MGLCAVETEEEAVEDWIGACGGCKPDATLFSLGVSVAPWGQDSTRVLSDLRASRPLHAQDDIIWGDGDGEAVNHEQVGGWPGRRNVAGGGGV